MRDGSDEPELMNPDAPTNTEPVTTHIRHGDLERLDNMAARRGVDRNALIVQAIDALLAQEAWNGGFIPPPPPMEVPRRTRDRGRMKRQARKKWKTP
ncbi:MAG: ribbon-helix-helix protein, CopG family [Actinobacteria bacterium]|nr:ribbon-helix-helix protein, CopG family [Actinomycetota bacterium]